MLTPNYDRFISYSLTPWLASACLPAPPPPPRPPVQRLPRIVGLPKAKELIFTGQRVEADEVLLLRLVEHLVDEGGGVQARLLTLGPRPPPCRCGLCVMRAPLPWHGSLPWLAASSPGR